MEDILPFGEAENLTINFYALTWGSFWINFGNNKVYKYMEEVRKELDIDNSYTTYYIIQFLKDLTTLI